jgi:hypothetical protein
MEAEKLARMLVSGPRLEGDLVWVSDHLRGGDNARVARLGEVIEVCDNGMLLRVRLRQRSSPGALVEVRAADVSVAVPEEIARAGSAEDLRKARGHHTEILAHWEEIDSEFAQCIMRNATSLATNERLDVEMWRLTDTIESMRRFALALDVADADKALLLSVIGPIVSSGAVGPAFRELAADTICDDTYKAWLALQRGPRFGEAARAENREALGAIGRAARAWLHRDGLERLMAAMTLSKSREGLSPWAF